MKNYLRPLTIITALITFLPPTHASLKRRSMITLMSYNAENLFDTKHDIGKNDYSYLPLSVKLNSPEVQEACMRMQNRYYRERCLNMDWNQDILNKKIQGLSRVIKIHSPDIVVLQEVENISVLKELVNKGLAGQGYREAVLIEGPDSRGIDVGIISKLPLAEAPKLHKVDVSLETAEKGGSTTRGILQATFSYGGKKFTVFGNHWPSQRNPDSHRVIAAKKLNELTSIHPYPVIATGDFNTLESDAPHAIKEYILNDNRAASFADAELKAFGTYRGTHYYKGEWSSLDRFFLSKQTFKRGCEIPSLLCLSPIWKSFKTIRKSWMLETRLEETESGEIILAQGVPKRFNIKTGEGFSDHLPIIMALKVNP